MREMKKLVTAVAVASSVMSANVVLAEGAVLEEVIVTATKRAESVQDVPISVNVVSIEAMKAFDIADPADLQNFVPGLQVQKTFGGTSVRIRGLGSGITNLAFDSSVPIYVDDVYSGRSNSMLSAFLDPGRVEVAKGPQGALYGKSTTAGAISIASAKPTEEFEGQIKIGTELEDGGYTASGYISGPLSDSVRGRLAVMSKDLDGWTKNLATGNDDGAEEAQAVRASFIFDIDKDSSAYLKLESGSQDTDGRNNQPVSKNIFPPVGPFVPFANNQQAEIDAGTLEFVADDKRGAATGFPREDYSEYEWNNLTFSYDTVVAGHDLKVIANHSDYNNVYFLDVDGYAVDGLNTFLEDDYEAQSFEVRVLSPVGQTVEYIAGAWYQTTDTDTRQWADYGTILPVPVRGTPLAFPVGTHRQYSRSVDSVSLYGQLKFNMTENFRAILDLRYTDEDHSANGQTRQVKWENFNNWTNPQLAPERNGLAEYTFMQNRTDSSFDPSLRLQYDASEDVMLYASYAQGSKAGGTKANDSGLAGLLLQAAAAGGDSWTQKYLGLGAATVTADYVANNVITLKEGNGIFDFEDEEAKSYELGFKSTLADGSVFLNAAVFTTEYSNLQTSSYNGTAFVIGNAGQATIDGAELDLNWQASDALRINAAVSVIDATYDSFEGASCVIDENLLAVNDDCSAGLGNRGDKGFEDQAGERLERSPKVEYNLTALWDQPISSSMTLKVAGSVYHSGDYFIQPTQEPYSWQDSYTKYDLRVALAASDDSWEVALNGRNLGDEQVISHAYRVFSRFNSLTRGRTLTLEGTYRF